MNFIFVKAFQNKMLFKLYLFVYYWKVYTTKHKKKTAEVVRAIIMFSS